MHHMEELHCKRADSYHFIFSSSSSLFWGGSWLVNFHIHPLWGLHWQNKLCSIYYFHHHILQSSPAPKERGSAKSDERTIWSSIWAAETNIVTRQHKYKVQSTSQHNQVSVPSSKARLNVTFGLLKLNAYNENMPPFKDDEVYKALNGMEQMKGTSPQWDLCSSKHIGGWLVHRFPQKKI